MAGTFIDEIVKSFNDTGEIKSSFLPEEVKDIILTSLNNTIRFNGAMERKYTVLQHSWMVGEFAADICSVDGGNENRQNTAQALGMLHDIGETIVGDTVKVLKTGPYADVYENTYGKLERAFRNWAADYAFGIKDFDKKWLAVGKYVEQADTFCGTLEMIGASKIGDFRTRQRLKPTFDNIEDSINRESFDFMIRQLAK